MVGKPMEDKLTNSLAEYVRKRQEYIKLKQRLWWRLGKKEEEKRKVSNRLRDEVVRQRKDIKRDHENQVREIRMEHKKREKDLTLPKELHRYKDA